VLALARDLRKELERTSSRRTRQSVRAMLMVHFPLHAKTEVATTARRAMSCKTACSRLHIHSAALGCGLSVILKYIDERNAQGASNVKRAIRKVIELIGQFPHGGSSIWEEEVRVVPVGHYPYAVYWLVTRREAAILHIRHPPRRGGGVGAFSSSRVSEIAACRMASLSGSGWLVLYAKRKRSSRDHTACKPITHSGKSGTPRPGHLG
jgi:plasmid stabilization system protein ParE